MAKLAIEVPDELLETIAIRAAEIAAANSSTAEEPDGYLETTGAAEFLACSTSRIDPLVSARPPPSPRRQPPALRPPGSAGLRQGRWSEATVMTLKRKPGRAV